MKERISRSEEQKGKTSPVPEKRTNRLVVSADEILKNTKQRRPSGKETVIFKKENTSDAIHIATVIGEILYTPETGEAVVDGITRKLTSRVRVLWEKFYTSPGCVFTKRELQLEVDPGGHDAGLKTNYVGTLVSRLREDIGDYDHEIIRTHGKYGYVFAKPDSEENASDWQHYQTLAGEVRYDPKTFRIRIANGEPIALTASMLRVWDEIIRNPGEKVPPDKLFFGEEKTEAASRMLMHRLQKRVGAQVINGSYDRGYALAIPDKKAKMDIKYNAESHQVVINSNPVKLSTYETLVWEYLYANPGKYLDKETLSTIVPLAPGSIIQRLRLKLGDSEKQIIKNVRGKGYFLSLS